MAGCGAEGDTESLGPTSIYDLSYKVTEVYWPFIKQMVKFSEVVPVIPFMRGIHRKIMSAEKEGDTEKSAQIFLDCLKQSPEEGNKYQAFVDALKTTNYTFLVKVLNGEADIGKYHEEHKHVITLYLNYLEGTIDPTEIAQDLRAEEIISPSDEEIIRNVQRQENRANASCHLLDAIPRRDPEWYYKFLKILHKHGHKRLVEMIDAKFFALFENTEDDPLLQNISSNVSTSTRTFGDVNLDPSDRISQNVESELNLELNPRAESVETVSSKDCSEVDRSRSLRSELEVSNLQTIVDELGRQVESIPRVEDKIDSLTLRVDTLTSLVEVMNQNFEKLLKKLEQN